MLLYNAIGYAQSLENPIIKQYSYKDYSGSVSNYDVKQSSNELLYIGNHNGLIDFDGNNWGLTQILNGHPIFVVNLKKDNQIYLGSENEFGYAAVNLKGELFYQSLSKEYENLEFGGISSITTSSNSVFYIASHHIFKYSGNNIKHWGLDKESAGLSSFISNDLLHFFIVGEGLFKINKQDEIEMVSNITKIDRILKVVDATDSTKLFLSGYGLQYIFQDDLIKIHQPYLKNIEDVLASQISIDIELLANPGSQIIATRKNGVYFIENNNIKHNSTQGNGLSNNDIRDIQLINHDLWMSNHIGINIIEQFGVWSYWGEDDNLNGIIKDLIKSDDNLFISTSSSVLNLSGHSFDQIGNNKESFNTFFKINHKLHINSVTRISQISNGKMITNAKLVSPQKTIVLSDSSSLTIDREGIYLMRHNLGTISIVRTISNNIGGISKSALLDRKRNAWFGIKNSGIVKVSSDLSISKYNSSNGLLDVINPFIFQHNRRVLFATGNGFYKLNPTPKSDSSNLFIPDDSLIKERIGISHPVSDARGNIWYVATYDQSSSYVEKLELQSDSSYIKVTQPFKRLPQQEFTKIYPDPVDEGMIWIAGTEGLYRFNDNIKVDYNQPFNTLVRKVHTKDSLIFAGTYYNPKDTATVPSIVLDQPSEFIPSLTYEHNQISFVFTATSYEVPEKNQYSYLLKGNGDAWSTWNTTTNKEYTNLSPGDYTFMVKSKNIYDIEGRIASYQFTVLPPWWMTSWAYVLYTIGGMLTFWMLTQIYTYRIRIQKRKLKLIVADRTFKVLKQSKEIEKQNDLLTEQKEEITQHLDDINEKNQELESSQEEILAINIRLKDLNDHLEVQVDTRTKKIKSTLERLRKTNKELDTFIYRASHDLKAPISRIMGLTILAKLEIPDIVNQEYFDLIELAANDMKKLLAKLTQVHELLNKTIVLKDIDVPTLLGNVKESLDHIDRNGDTKYSFNIKDQLSFHSDEDVIQVIIENLLENAITFRKENTEERHHISIKLFKKQESIHIIIHDNGIGIDSNNHAQLFDMFFRGSDRSKGTGLGLYLVKMAVDNLDGTIAVNSELDQFTEFTIQLPIK